MSASLPSAVSVTSLRSGLNPMTSRLRGSVSWQTMLADLALILFMVTAAAMGQQPQAPVPARRQSDPPPPAPYSARGEALAIWREAPGAPTLRAWLAAQAADPRQQLTISALYRQGHLAAALTRASALAAEAGAMGRAARIVVEPADGPANGGPGAAGNDTGELAANERWPYGARLVAPADLLELSASLAFDRPDPAPEPAVVARGPGSLAQGLLGSGQADAATEPNP